MEILHCFLTFYRLYLIELGGKNDLIGNEYNHLLEHYLMNRFEIWEWNKDEQQVKKAAENTDWQSQRDVGKRLRNEVLREIDMWMQTPKKIISKTEIETERQTVGGEAESDRWKKKKKKG